MPSLHRVSKSPFWHCAFYLPDGRRTLRSTGRSKKNEAWGVCMKFVEASKLAKEQRLSENRARETISDIFMIGNNERLSMSSVEDYLKSWCDKKKLEVSESSLPEYEKAVAEFLTYLGPKAKKPIDAIAARDAVGFRGSLIHQLSPATVNKKLKLLRGGWTHAMRDGLVQENIFTRVEMVKQRDEERVERRAFTLNEVKTLLKSCNHEWRGMILAGLYTGQRLGDLAALTWDRVDLVKQEIRFVTQKTSRRMTIPIAKLLNEYLVECDAQDNPSAPVFPGLHVKPVQTLSNEFRNILAGVGLSKPVPHEKDKTLAKSRRRKVNDISFHALRHTATTLLKAAGISDAVTREFIGHDSETVSRHYTHIETSTLRNAVDRMPDVTGELTK